MIQAIRHTYRYHRLTSGSWRPASVWRSIVGARQARRIMRELWGEGYVTGRPIPSLKDIQWATDAYNELTEEDMEVAD